ncbi:MAG: hypothetical protein R3F62_15685 [Planctomycetota bacterium]
MTRARELALLAGVLLVGGWLRLGALGADVPIEVGLSYAPVQDAAWYVEAAAREVEGVPQEGRTTPWDLPLWRSLAATWFRLVGAGHWQNHALGALLSLATVLALWRFAQPLGRGTALAAAAALAVLYPTVLLGRTALIYGPAALLLLACAALWRVGAGRPRAQRLACELGAWGVVLAAAALARPPLLALAGGLFAGHLVRSARPGHWLAVGGGLGVLGALGVLALPVLRAIPWFDELGFRLAGHGFSVDPLRLFLDLWRAGGDPDQSGSGYARLAVPALLVGTWGVALALQRAPRLSQGAREVLALLGGWALWFYLANVPFTGRPLRYWALFGPPLAAFVGVGLCWTRATLEVPWGAVAVAAVAGVHVAGALGEQLLGWPLGLTLALGGAAGGVGALAAAARAPRLPRRWHRALGAGVLLALLWPSARMVLGATRWTDAARLATDELLPPEALLCGPYAPVLAQGTGRPRLLGLQLRTDQAEGRDFLAEGLAWAKARGVTHVALGLGQEQSSQLRFHAARYGVELEPVALLYVGGPPDLDFRARRVRGDHVLILAFPWAPELRPARSPSARLARLAGLCAAGEPDRARALLDGTSGGVRGTLEAALRRTVSLPTVSVPDEPRKY